MKKKFLAIYFVPAAALKEMMKASDEEKKAGMDGWTRWVEENKKSIVDEGAPLGKTKSITARGVSDAKNEIGAYTIVQADSHEAAAELFVGHPHFMLPGSSIEIMEFLPMDM